ncbi:hypothetical protein LTR27_008333 [Elasticomyces elasticus]|nr:hypothetical protein LTR27_008333 [Elasticomyces elasticus]
MHHPDGISVQVRNLKDAWKEEYTGRQMIETGWPQGQYDVAYITETPGEEFLVKVWFGRFMLHGGQGVEVTVSCGHGEDLPGGVDHAAYHWIGADVMTTHHFRLGHYDLWKEEQEDVHYIMPAPSTHRRDQTQDQVYRVPEGSIRVHIRRICTVNQDTAPCLVCANDPRADSSHCFRELRGEHGKEYVFEFINLGCVNINDAGLQLREDSGALDPDPPEEVDESDCEFGEDSADGEWLPSRLPVGRYGARKLNRNTRSKTATKTKKPADGHGVSRRPKSTVVSVEQSSDAHACNDQDDDENLELHRGFGIVKTPESLQSEQPATAMPAEEELYGDSRHPSLYNEPDNGPAIMPAVGPLERLTASEEGPSDVPETSVQGVSAHEDGDDALSSEPQQPSNAVRDTTPPQQQPHPVVDLTMADSDEDEDLEDEQAELQVRDADVKIARRLREEAQAEKERLHAKLALERKMRAQEEKKRAREMQRQADADREERMRIKRELKMEDTK